MVYEGVMADHIIETVNTSGNRLLLFVSALLVVVGFIGFFWLDNQAWYVRDIVLVVSVILGVIVSFFSMPGKNFVAFAKDSHREVRKVVWPTRKEAMQTTLVVCGFVLVMAVFLWVSDRCVEWVIFSAILGWK